MKDYSNNSFESNVQDHHLDMAQISEFVMIEVLIVLVSLFIVSTNILVIYRINKFQAKNVRFDFAFICLSISDMAVGLFSAPIEGAAFYYYKSLRKQSVIMIILRNFFRYFLYTFSCLFTTIIAVDRLFIITLDRKYKDIVTLQVLKVVAIILFLCIVANSSMITVHNRQSRGFTTRCEEDFLTRCPIVPMAISILSTHDVILAHLYILYFVLKRSGLKQSKKYHDKNGQTPTNTISSICINQLNCVIPYLVFQFAAQHISDKLFFTIDYWLVILVACQCFCNALIILRIKKKKQKISELIEREATLITDTS